MSTTIERPQTMPDLSDEELARLRTVRERQTPGVAPPRTVRDALTVDGFRSWLASKQEYDLVGMPRSASSCPLYSYLTETFRKRYSGFSVSTIVDYHDYGRTALSHMDNLPQWATEFIQLVDKGFGPIRAKEARAILDRVSKRSG